MKQVTANVYTEDRFSVPPRYRGSNPGYVTTSEGIVMIDTPMMPTDAVRWRDKIAAEGEVRYIINTHHHLDHTTGNYFFPGARVITHEEAREMFTAPVTRVVPSMSAEVLAKEGDTVGHIRAMVSKYDPPGLALLKDYRLKGPDITFTDRLSLYVGKHTFELFHQPGHTPSHIGVYIPEEKVFFAGDNFTNGTQPALADSLPLEWVKSLKQIEAMDIEVVVPGHGEICDKGEVREFRRFIETCIRLVREAIRQGKSAEAAADSLSFEGLYPGSGGTAVHPGPEMQRRNVLRLYEMLSSRGSASAR